MDKPADRMKTIIDGLEAPHKLGEFSAALINFNNSKRSAADYSTFLKAFEACCSTWTWGEIETWINQVLYPGTEKEGKTQ